MKVKVDEYGETIIVFEGNKEEQEMALLSLNLVKGFYNDEKSHKFFDEYIGLLQIEIASKGFPN